MAGGGEEPLGVLDPHDLVLRGVQEEERAAERGHGRVDALPLQVVEELTPDAEPASRQLDLGGVGFLELGVLAQERVAQMGGLAGRADRRDRADLRDPPGGDERGGTPQAVADEQARGLVLRAQEIGGRDQVRDVGR